MAKEDKKDKDGRKVNSKGRPDFTGKPKEK